MQKIWWEQVPKALLFCSDIVNSLLDEKSILLHHSEALPWESYFKSFVKDSVAQKSATKTFHTLSDTDSPGSALLQEFCAQTKRAQYRPSKGYAAFLAQSDDIVLHNQYLWINISSIEQLDVWTSFVADYLKERGHGKDRAVFILDWRSEDPPSRRKGITLFSFDAYISEYDRIVFSTLASSSISERTEIKNYLAELTANVLGNDIELNAECISRHKDFMRNPFMVITNIVESSERSDGSTFQFDKSAPEVDRLIWLAQIRSIYPLIEEYREIFIQSHKTAIRAQLPISSSYEEVYTDPNDVELGTLYYMASSGALPLISDEYVRLKAFRDARNTLSHLGLLTFEDILNLLE